MKFQLLIYKQKFTITEKEKEEYFCWYWLPEPEIKTKEDIESRLHRLRDQIAWIRKISKKYNKALEICKRWNMNGATNEITIL